MSNIPSRRRDFLRSCARVGLGLAAPMRLHRTVRADDNRELPSYDGPYYIVFNAAGGWDTTYLMDPKGVGGINRLYKNGDILTHGVHRFAPTRKHKQGGLSNEDFFTEFGEELLVFNGLDYSVNNHSPCSRYMATGKLDSLAYPTFAALVAACQGPSCPLSFLTFGNYSATGNLVAMSRVPYLPSLKRIANADSIEGNQRAPYHDDFALNRIEGALAERRAQRTSQPLLPRRQPRGKHVVCGSGQFEGTRAGHAACSKRHPQAATGPAGGDRPGVVQSWSLRLGEPVDRTVRQPRQ